VTAGIGAPGPDFCPCDVLVGFFNSIMFPTIFALSLKKSGRPYKARFFLLVNVHHWRRDDSGSDGPHLRFERIRVALVMPLICYLYVIISR